MRTIKFRFKEVIQGAVFVCSSSCQSGRCVGEAPCRYLPTRGLQATSATVDQKLSLLNASGRVAASPVARQPWRTQDSRWGDGVQGLVAPAVRALQTTSSPSGASLSQSQATPSSLPRSPGSCVPDSQPRAGAQGTGQDFVTLAAAQIRSKKRQFLMKGDAERGWQGGRNNANRLLSPSCRPLSAYKLYFTSYTFCMKPS